MKALNTYIKPTFANFILPIIVTVIGTLAYDFIKDVPLLSSLSSSLFWIRTIIVSFFTYSIPIYVILIIIASSLIILKVYNRLTKDIDVGAPSFLRYTSDNLKNWKWSWEYGLYSDKYRIKNLRPHCLACDYVLKYDKDTWGTCRAECPNCKKLYLNHFVEDIDDITMMIEHRITTNQYTISERNG